MTPPLRAPLPLAVLAGQLLVGGFFGASLPPSYRDALERGERGGAILFRRNLQGSLADAAALNRELAGAATSFDASFPPLLAVDQEGGRVTRLGAPLLKLPPMRALGRTGDALLVRRAGKTLGRELAALGFTMNFAPVLDVDSCPDNPIIGDRSFASSPEEVARIGHAFAAGLQEGGVHACGKHFPGHGDTTVDSHFDLPRVDQPRTRLDAIELVPYLGLRAAVCAAVMTAHVVYPALEPDAPATLSRRIAHDLLRGELGYDGVLVSDDLEMKAVADRMPIEESAVRAVRAGCDVLLVCSSEELQERAHAALVRAAEADPAFHARLTEAAERGLELRRARPPRPLPASELAAAVGGPESRALAEELEARGVFA